MCDEPKTTKMERRTICLPDLATQGVLQHGDPAFRFEMARLYSAPENDATESVMKLKNRLMRTPTDDFWSLLTEGMASVLGAEMTFVMKRVLVDEQNAAVEMPPHGAPGSCMMATAFHYQEKDGTKDTIKETKFDAYGCPCAYMRHDKVFLIPDNLDKFIANNPNGHLLKTPADAYMAVPLFADGKCIAHFGCLWSKESASLIQLSWAFIEMLMHSVEDLICDRLVEGSNFLRSSMGPREVKRVIPHNAVTVAQSLRPYAGSLSHELRTPMQGVVGMLDVMYATVLEAVETQADPSLRRVFENLKENIEVSIETSETLFACRLLDLC